MDDVTEKILAQEKASLARVQTDFFARMSHELRTPMHGILGMLEVLRGTPLTMEQLDSVDVIKNSGKHLLVVLNSILDFSKLDAGMVKLENEYFNVRQLFNDIRRIHSAANQHVSLQFSVDISLPDELYGDSHRLTQCMNNLLSNAVKFTSNMQKAHVFVNVRKHEEKLIISVADSGIGMDEKTKAKLFSPFMQANSKITQTFGGTGLGLANTKQLITQMGGSILVESELNKGSTFIVVLPILIPEKPKTKSNKRKMEELSDKQSKKPRLNNRNVRILLAEDNPTSRKIGIALLQKRGFSVDAVEDGQKALDYIEQHSDLDILLLDIQMPVLGGHDTCRLLRQRGWNKPIIALTASAMESDKNMCLAIGMNDYLSKPFVVDELEDKILTLCKMQ